MKTIGILGGMGPLATIDLYKRIILRTKANKDQDHIHVIIDSNTKIPDRTQCIISNGKSPLNEMIKSAHKLEKAGADFLIMPCNTAHYFYNELIRNIDIPFLNMLEITVNYITENYGKEIVAGLLATDGTNKSGIYGYYFNKANIKLIRPEKFQSYVMNFIYNDMKTCNYNLTPHSFLKAIDELKENGADIFILGCTELSLWADIYNFKEKFVDPIDILAEKAITFAGAQLKT